MRIPAVAIVAAFACGIAMGLHSGEILGVRSVSLLSSCFIAGFVLILTGFVLIRIGRLFSAALLSLFSWVLLGFLGASVAEQPKPSDHVTSFVEQGRLQLQTPLRW